MNETDVEQWILSELGETALSIERMTLTHCGNEIALNLFGGAIKLKLNWGVITSNEVENCRLRMQYPVTRGRLKRRTESK